MLPVDLIRATPTRGVLRAGYLDPGNAQWLEHAAELIEIFQDHVGHTQGELDESLKDFEGATPRFRTTRGLAKLLFGRTEVITDSPLEPVELRRRVFDLAAARHPVVRGEDGEAVRNALIAEIAREVGTTPQNIERGLYADLKEAQTVDSFDPIEPEELLSRYNVALAQGLLLRATRLEIVIALGTAKAAAARFRQLFRYLKFFQLLHTIEPVEKKDGKAAKGKSKSRAPTPYRITIDGPMSILKNTGRYGFQMACFLPALLLCDGWTATADVLWGTERTPMRFELSSEDGLHSHFKDRGVYETEEERFFVSRFEKHAEGTDWELVRDDPLVPLGGQSLWIPDFRIRNKADGREALFEIIGYWRADYLRRRLELLARHGPGNLVLAVSDKMKLDDDELAALPVEVVWFKKVIRARQVLDAVDKVATAPR